MNIPEDDPRAVAMVSAIRDGDVTRVRQWLAGDAALATARIVDARGVDRSLLHIVSDWPGHFPNGAEMVKLLIAAGADPQARVACSPAAETPLHWAASSDDVAVLDALLDGGADIEAPGAVFTGGTAMSDAVVFARWNAARRLLARGARTTFWQAAALGLTDRVAEEPASQRDITNAFWHACRGGQRDTAAILLNRGADLNWIGYDRRTPLDAAQESNASEVVEWLRAQGARSANES
jgi:uncharacterized protein